MQQRSDLKTQALMLVACDRRITLSAVRWFAVWVWHYRPGIPWVGQLAVIGAEAGLSQSSTVRATGALQRLGHVLRFGGGLVSPVIEAHLPPEQQLAVPGPTQEQLEFMHSAPATTKRYLRRWQHYA